MNKKLRSLLVGTAVLLLIVIGVIYSKSSNPASPTGSVSPTSTEATSPTGSGTQSVFDLSAAVDTNIASAREEKTSVDSSETDTNVIDELDTEINAYGNVYVQSELN